MMGGTHVPQTPGMSDSGRVVDPEGRARMASLVTMTSGSARWRGRHAAPIRTVPGVSGRDMIGESAGDRPVPLFHRPSERARYGR